MNNDILWRLPYAKLESGKYANAIILYGKEPILMRNLDRGEHPEGRFYSVPVKWYHVLLIDLWIVTFRFRWESGEK